MLIKGKRRGLSAEQKAELWNRWKAGQSLNEIGRALGKDHGVVHFVLERHGGIAPPARRRSRRVLTLAEREDISRGIASGCAMRVIARGLHRSASTIRASVQSTLPCNTRGIVNAYRLKVAVCELGRRGTRA